MSTRTDVAHTEGTEVDTGVKIKDATVTVKKAVDGTKKRKPRSDKGKKRKGSLSEPTKHVVVDPRVMAAARAARKPGQRLVIVDAECVRLVNAS